MAQRRFAMRLALQVGEPNVDALLRRITWRQLVEWVAYSELEPFGFAGQVRFEHRVAAFAASIVQALYNLFARKKGQPMFELEGFLVKFSDTPLPEAKRTQTVAQQRSVLMLVARAYGAKGK